MTQSTQKVTYKILYGDANSLEQQVNEYLQNGWELQGGISAKGHEFIQSLVLTEYLECEPEDYVTTKSFSNNLRDTPKNELYEATMRCLELFVNNDYPLNMAIQLGAKALNYPSTQDIKDLIIKGAPQRYLESRAFIDARKRDIADPMYEPHKV